MASTSESPQPIPATPRPAPTMWKLPYPYGRGAAIDAMAGIAAPLLAGFSLTLAGVIASSPQSFRWPGIDLVMLVLTIVLLVACIQFGFHARMHLYSAGDLRDWRPDVFEWIAARPHVSQEFSMALKDQQAADFQMWHRWERRARLAYNLAIVVLAAGVALTLAPHTSSKEAGWRWAALAIAAAGGIAECCWIAIDFIRRIRKESRHGSHYEQA